VVTEADVSRLRRDEEADPGLAAMEAIAKVFGVSVAFFTDELTDAQAWVAAEAAGRGARDQMTPEQMSLEVRVAVNVSVDTVLDRWAATAALTPSLRAAPGQRGRAGSRRTDDR
jgi:hypothetical protein